MLKIEKKRGKTRLLFENDKTKIFFTKTFRMALFWAITLHLAAFLIFRIGPFKWIYLERLPSSFVDTALSNEEVMKGEVRTGRRVNQTFQEIHFRFLAQTSSPRLPSLNQENFKTNDESLPLVSSKKRLDDDFLEDSFIVLEKLEKKKKKSSITFRGGLAQKKAKGAEENFFEELIDLKEGFVSFAVKVENETGALFWIEPLVSDLKPAHLELVKKQLKKLRFSPSLEEFVTSGEIEVFFKKGNED